MALRGRPGVGAARKLASPCVPDLLPRDGLVEEPKRAREPGARKSPSYTHDSAKNAPRGFAQVFTSACSGVRAAHRRSDRPAFWPRGQVLTRQTRKFGRTSARGLLAVTVMMAAVLGIMSCGRSTKASRGRGQAAMPARGGEMVASIHSDPRSFNRFVTSDLRRATWWPR